MDIKNLEELARLMKENGLTVLEMTEDGRSIRLERRPQEETADVLPDAPEKQPSRFAPTEADGGEIRASAQKEGALVRSPMVGVFYSAPSPESAAFVEVGDRVSKGDTLCIIEAMKLMNEISAEVDGVVVEICAGNGQLVEFNQPLFRIVSETASL